MTGLSQELQAMTEWPHTPTANRLTAAMDLHLTLSENAARLVTIDTTNMSPDNAKKAAIAALDQNELTLLLDHHAWESWALQTFQTGMTNHPDSNAVRVSLLSSIAAAADQEDTLGLAVLSKQPPPTDGDPKLTLGFARMLRIPDWMGFCPLLKTVAGALAIVVESRRNPGRIGHVTCLPPDIIAPRPNAWPRYDDIPLPGGDHLTTILQFHDVDSIHWNPVNTPA